LVRFFSSSLFSQKARHISPGVDVTVFHPGAKPVLDLRAHLSMTKEEIIIACVAELVPVKGHPDLLKAIAEIPNVHLLLAGRPSDGTYSQGLAHQASQLGISPRTHFLGRVENIPALLAESDIFLLPTIGKGEGCAIALLEAMACAKACIATNVPGSRDVIQHGKNGLLAEPENPSSLANAIQQLVWNSQLRLALGQSAREDVESKYTIQREVDDYVHLYDELIGVASA